MGIQYCWRKSPNAKAFIPTWKPLTLSTAFLNVFFRMLAEVCAKVVPLVFMLLILGSLGQESYGLQIEIDNLRAMCAPIAALGLGLGLVRVTSGSANRAANARYLLYSLFSSLIASLAIMLLIQLNAATLNSVLFRVVDVEPLVRLSAVLVPLTALESHFNDFCRGRLYIGAYSASQIMAALAAIGGVYVALQYGGGLLSVVQVLIATKLFSVVFLVARLAVGGEFSIPSNLLRQAGLSRWLIGGLPVMATSLLAWGVSLGDRFIVGGLRSAVEVGQYAAAYNTMLIVTAVAAPFWGPMYPLMASRLNRDDEVGAADICRRYTTAYALFAFPCFAGLILVGPQLLSYVTKGNATVGWLILFVLGLGLLTDQLAAGFHYYFYAKGQPGKAVKVLSIACAANWIGNLALVPWLGIMGAAVMTLVTFATVAVLLMLAKGNTASRIGDFYNFSSLGIYAASTVVMVVTLLAVADIENVDLVTIVTNVAIGVAVYGLALLLFHRARVDVFLQALKS